MTSWHRPAVFLLYTLSFLWFAGLATAQDPQHTITYFDNLPGRLFFLEDTSTAIFHDTVEGNVYVSQDEGKTWELADIPKNVAALVIDHPFDNRYAFIITKQTTHYRSDDRGRTWRSFEVPIPPSYTAAPLSFHSEPTKFGYILYQGTRCEHLGWGSICHDETHYTTDAFSEAPKLLLSETSRCQFAHSSKDFKHDAHEDLIYCVAFDTPSANGMHSIASSRLFSSTDFFQSDKSIEDLGIGKDAKGVLGLAIVSKFAVVALKDLSAGNNGDMALYATVNTKEWAKAQFPHSSTARLRENAYTIVESTIHSLAVDVLLYDQSAIGTLFTSNSNGTFFVESLKDTNRNMMGYVDYENLYGVEGVGIANIVANAQDVESKHLPRIIRSLITFDDGSSWAAIRAPSTNIDGERISCNPTETDECSLHLHSVTQPHNLGRVFSSSAPGLVMGVGSIGNHLLPYEECDTFISTDAGISWRMVRRDAHLYEFGDQGSIIVAVNDEESVDTIQYSTDFGKNWRSYNLGIKMRVKALTTVSDSSSQKFLILGQVARQDQTQGYGRYGVIFIDFANTRSRKCDESDFEKWYARSSGDKECLMGHKQWYRRRKADAACYVGEKFMEPVEHEDNCPCSDEDFECDYNFVRNGNKCVPVGPEKVPNDICTTGSPEETYMGSSGYRLVAGNTCDKSSGLTKDDPVSKPCSAAQPAEGEIIHQQFEFPAQIVQHEYFADSTTILVRLADASIWQSSNEGYTWSQVQPGVRFWVFYMHSYTNDRAYLVTDNRKFFITTDTGKTWREMNAPLPPNMFGAQILHFHPQSDYLIWTGNAECENDGQNCRAQAQYSRDNGRSWHFVEDYVRNCAWARDAELRIDPTQILCESYLNKRGSQKFFGLENPLQLIGGTNFFETKTKLFDHVVGFTKFSEFLIVAEYLPQQRSLNLQVSLDGRTFAAGMFPPSMHPDTHAYTVLESSTMSIFLHMTMTDFPNPFWGNILKSNSNGTYFGLSLENANRNDQGYVDFEKLVGLDGIAIVNIVANPQEAIISRNKQLQTRITHNDGGTWKPLTPPIYDSQGRKYDCTTTSCALQIHGYTERYDARATYSSPGVVGVVMAVGNVGEVLAPYTESDTFLSRDGGFTWEEVHKDAHLWEFGDSGSIILIVNDEEPTDHILFTTDEGLNWREYQFSSEKIRILSIVTVPEDTSRRFILLGKSNRGTNSVAIHIDFSSLTHKQCILSVENPGEDDFELWSPSEERTEACLFGRQTLYHRRVRDRSCVVGKQPKAQEKVVRNCECSTEDFECEFNYVKNAAGECVLVPGTVALESDDSCRGNDDYWYERTAYRKIQYSSCEGGKRLDRGPAHLCPGINGHSFAFWLFIIAIPFLFTFLVAYWWYRRRGMARGTIRLPGGDNQRSSRLPSDSGALATLASVPWFLLGLAGVAWEYMSSTIETLSLNFRSHRGYRDVPVDEDAQILRFEDEGE